MKQCALCKIEKPLSEFSKNARYKDGYYKHCKNCHYEHYGRHNHILKTYGLTKEDYLVLLSNQKYMCFGCGVDHIEDKRGRLFVDHCHTTGKVRGLLCQGCNFALGAIKDNTDTLKNLIKYLEKSNGS